MTWVPMRGAVRRMRQARKLEQRELAKKSGMTERAIRLYESKGAPKTMYASTVKALAGALACDPEDLATWIAVGRGADPGQDADVETHLALPPVGTLARRAQSERALGGPATLETPDGALELLGPDRLSRVMTACAGYREQRFAVAGRVRQHKPLPEPAARVLAVEVGVGARFELARQVARGVPFYTTVYTRSTAHTEALLDHHAAATRVSLAVRIVVAPPEGAWKGFFIFEKRPRPQPFVFVVDAILA